jgi:uncharacterized protein with GYD domain
MTALRRIDPAPHTLVREGAHHQKKEVSMPLYLFQCAYTPQSLAAQMKNPVNRLEVVGQQISATGVRFVAGGFSFGDHDVTAIMEAPDDTAMAAVSVAIGAGGGVRNARTTRLLSGAEYVEALKKAASVGYKPAAS